MSPSPHRLVRRILPILGTTLLIYWLTGGIPPIALIHLEQASSSLATSTGTSSLLLLASQSLLVGLAWILLLFLLLRELATLLLSDLRGAEAEHSAPRVTPSVQSTTIGAKHDHRRKTDGSGPSERATHHSCKAHQVRGKAPYLHFPIPSYSQHTLPPLFRCNLPLLG